MGSISKEVQSEIPGIIRVFKDGSVERLFGFPQVPPTPQDPETSVSSKDVVISANKNVSARLHLPKLTSHNARLPILVYFHGGGFCIGSAFSLFDHRYMSIIASQAQVLIVSVEYRLAPEHPLPTAYEDCWTALNWVASLSDPWLATHGDLEAVFVGGDSAGANIVHNMVMRAGVESLDRGVKVLGAFLSHPYFMDEKGVPQLDILYKMWELTYPGCGLDSPFINPTVVGAPSLSGLGCSQMLVVVSEKDELRDSGVRYYEAVKKSGFEGKMELLEVPQEGHCFHFFNTGTHNAKLVFQRLASFLHK